MLARLKPCAVRCPCCALQSIRQQQHADARQHRHTGLRQNHTVQVQAYSAAATLCRPYLLQGCPSTAHHLPSPWRPATELHARACVRCGIGLGVRCHKHTVKKASASQREPRSTRPSAAFRRRRGSCSRSSLAQLAHCSWQLKRLLLQLPPHTQCTQRTLCTWSSTLHRMVMGGVLYAWVHIPRNGAFPLINCSSNLSGVARVPGGRWWR